MGASLPKPRHSIISDPLLLLYKSFAFSEIQKSYLIWSTILNRTKTLTENQFHLCFRFITQNKSIRKTSRSNQDVPSSYISIENESTRAYLCNTQTHFFFWANSQSNNENDLFNNFFTAHSNPSNPASPHLVTQSSIRNSLSKSAIVQNSIDPAQINSTSTCDSFLMFCALVLSCQFNTSTSEQINQSNDSNNLSATSKSNIVSVQDKLTLLFQLFHVPENNDEIDSDPHLTHPELVLLMSTCLRALYYVCGISNSEILNQIQITTINQQLFELTKSLFYKTDQNPLSLSTSSHHLISQQTLNSSIVSPLKRLNVTNFKQWLNSSTGKPTIEYCNYYLQNDIYDALSKLTLSVKNLCYEFQKIQSEKGHSIHSNSAIQLLQTLSRPLFNELEIKLILNFLISPDEPGQVFLSEFLVVSNVLLAFSLCDYDQINRVNLNQLNNLLWLLNGKQSSVERCIWETDQFIYKFKFDQNIKSDNSTNNTSDSTQNSTISNELSNHQTVNTKSSVDNSVMKINSNMQYINRYQWLNYSLLPSLSTLRRAHLSFLHSYFESFDNDEDSQLSTYEMILFMYKTLSSNLCFNERLTSLGESCLKSISILIVKEIYELCDLEETSKCNWNCIQDEQTRLLILNNERSLLNWFGEFQVNSRALILYKFVNINNLAVIMSSSASNIFNSAGTFEIDLYSFEVPAVMR